MNKVTGVNMIRTTNNVALEMVDVMMFDIIFQCDLIQFDFYGGQCLTKYFSSCRALQLTSIMHQLVCLTIKLFIFIHLQTIILVKIPIQIVLHGEMLDTVNYQKQSEKHAQEVAEHVKLPYLYCFILYSTC